MPAGVEVERLWCEWAPWWAPCAGGRSACPEARYLWGKGWGWAPWWAHPPSAEVPAKSEALSEALRRTEMRARDERVPFESPDYERYLNDLMTGQPLEGTIKDKDRENG